MFFRSARIMTRISSSVLLWKYAIPVAVLAHCAWLIASPLLNGAPIGGHIVISRLLLALSAVLVFKIFAFDLADSVDDGGDHFIVRRGRVTERVEFADVAWVDFKAYRPPRVILHLFAPNRLGSAIPFYPATSKMQIALHLQGPGGESQQTAGAGKIGARSLSWEDSTLGSDIRTFRLLKCSNVRPDPSVF